MAAAIEAFFAALWLAWGQGSAPSWLNPLSLAASIVAIALVVTALVAAARSRGQHSALDQAAARRRYNVVVGLELGLLAAGAALLGLFGLTRWIIVWAGVVVGAHFVPLARVFRGLHLVALGLLVLAVAAASLVVGLVSNVSPGAVAGLGTGLSLLLASIAHLAAAASTRR